MFGFVFNHLGYTHVGQLSSNDLSENLHNSIIEMLKICDLMTHDPYEIEEIQNIVKQLTPVPNCIGVLTGVTLVNEKLFEIYLFEQGGNDVL